MNMPEDNCPHCNKKLSYHEDSKEEGWEPQKDDYSVCFYCFGISQFNANGTLRKADEPIPQHVKIEVAMIRKFKSVLN